MVSEKKIENWEQYKGLEYYPEDISCACGCGSRIKVKFYHRKYGIPKYISGHNRAGRKKIPCETRTCACGCGGTFKCKVSSKQRFLPHHNIRKLRRKKIPKETRFCACGCKETFECKINSKQRFIHGHNRRNVPLSKEHKRKIGDSHSGKSCKGRNKLPRIKKICPGCEVEFTTSTGWGERKFHSRKCYWKYLKECWNDPIFAAMMGRAQGRKPNGKEKQFDELLQKLFFNEWKYVGDFQVWFGGKNPDFININGQKKIIELFGDYWHGEELVGIPNGQHEQERINHFTQFGFQTLVIWEHELKDTEKLTEKLLCFNQIGG